MKTHTGSHQWRKSLKFINDTDSEIKNVKSNVLFTIRNGRVIGEDPIDRSQRKQVEKLQVNWEKKNQVNAKNRYNDYYDGSWYDSEWDEAWPASKGFKTNIPNMYSINAQTDMISTPRKHENKIF